MRRHQPPKRFYRPQGGYRRSASLALPFPVFFFETQPCHTNPPFGARMWKCENEIGRAASRAQLCSATSALVRTLSCTWLKDLCHSGLSCSSSANRQVARFGWPGLFGFRSMHPCRFTSCLARARPPPLSFGFIMQTNVVELLYCCQDSFWGGHLWQIAQCVLQPSHGLSAPPLSTSALALGRICTRFLL